MRILVLGGDGFCGWPTSLYLSNKGHEITIVDNLSRRKIDIELEVDSLTPIAFIGERLKAWKEVSGNKIKFENLLIFSKMTMVQFPSDCLLLSIVVWYKLSCFGVTALKSLFYL